MGLPRSRVVATRRFGVVGTRCFGVVATQRFRVLATLVLMFALVGARGVVCAATQFPEPAALRHQVDFWTKVFGVYSKHQVLIHDNERLDRIYAVLDYREDAASGMNPVTLANLRKADIAREKTRLRGVLKRLAKMGGTKGLTAEERRIRALFKGTPTSRQFAAAAEPGRLRTQSGLLERFREGIRISRRYLPAMEEIFRQEGMPLVLTRLPLVESCFDVRAYSKVGAAGIWQFMPATGRRYMRIGGVIDERRDPLRATRGAARYLKSNFKMLGTWPLAITAYNHGEGGVRRAVRETGTTDIGRIVERYHGPRFGFASRNFYAEFLAAVAVERDYEAYFGPLTFEAPFKSDEVRLGSPVAGKVAVASAGTSVDALAALNPAVESSVFRRNRNLPKGYVLRVPAGTASGFEQRLAKVPASKRAIAPPRVRTHRVARGQTLSLLARRYGTSVRSLQRANRLGGTRIRIGQVLKIPTGSRAQPSRTAAARTHRVRRGQTLSQLARRYRVSVRDIQRANRLRGTVVRTGQVLKIPAS